MFKRSFLVVIHSFLVGLVLLQGPSLAVAADDEPAADSGFGLVTEAVYKSLDRCYFMIIPLVNSGVGGFMGGTKGAALGLVIGMADELLMNTGVEDAYYLSAAFLGAGSFDKLELPYHAQHAAGGLIGLGIVSRKLDSIRDYVGNPVHGAINGMVYAGIPGAVVAGMGGAVDAVLSATDLTEGDYLSNLALSLAQAKALGTAAGMIAYFPKVGDAFNAYLANNHLPRGTAEAFAACLFAFKLYNQEGNVSEEDEAVANAKTSFEIIDAFSEAMSEVVDPRVLDELMQRQAIIMVAMPLLGSQLAVQLYKYCQDFDTQLAAFENIKPGTGKKFFEAVSFLGIFVIPYVGEFFVSNLLNDYQGRTLAIIAQDALHARLVDGEMPLKLACHEESAALIDAMDANLYSIASTGERLLAKIAESQIKGVYGVCTLSKHHALDFAVLAQFFNDLFMAVGVALGEMENAVEQEMLPLKSQIGTLQKEWHKNPRNIVYGDKQSLLSDKEAELKETIRTLSQQQALLSVFRGAFFTSKSILLNFVFNYGFVARKMLGDGLPVTEKLPYIDYSTVLSSARGLLESYGWYSENAGSLMEFNQAKMNVQKLVGFMNQEEEDLSSIAYVFEEGAANRIFLKDFSVGHESATLLTPQTIEIPQGVYAVSGASGSGKTSFLSKIQGISYNGIWGQGEVVYTSSRGDALDIYQVTQVDYLVSNATLFELISLKSNPGNASHELEARMRDLLIEIAIDDKDAEGLVDQLHAKKDWNMILSGGQKRKIAIVGVILRSPDIVILDEVFNGLDVQSVKTAQSMLRAYLPETLMLIVDHNYELNNYNSFYEARVHLENKTINILQF